MKRINDSHCHTLKSDGVKSLQYRETQISKQLETKSKLKILAIITNHDCLAEKLSGDGFDTFQGSEISTYSQTLKQYAHVCIYADCFSKKVDTALAGVQNIKKNNLEKNISLLNENGFNIDILDFFEYFKTTTGNGENLNNFQLSSYMMLSVENRTRARDLYQQETGETIIFSNSVEGSVLFLKGFLKKSGRCSRYGLSKERDIVGIDIDNLHSLVEIDSGIMTLAHPHITFQKGIPQFLEMFPIYYHEHGVRAIEIPTTANLEWTNAILKIAEKYNCITTFGSDSHGYEPDSSHGEFLTVNPFIEEKFISYKTDEFIEKLS